MKQLTGRGGPRRGQGRHPKPANEKYVPCGLRLPPDIDKWLRDNIAKNKKSLFIVEAIREKIAAQ